MHESISWYKTLGPSFAIKSYSFNRAQAVVKAAIITFVVLFTSTKLSFSKIGKSFRQIFHHECTHPSFQLHHFRAIQIIWQAPL